MKSDEETRLFMPFSTTTPTTRKTLMWRGHRLRTREVPNPFYRPAVPLLDTPEKP